ncbi:UDP-N-acetylglucosamine 1-carboxyvinyltransferase [Halomonas sp. Y3]|uniref:UDP-N-acetylglucosamine 1-carboxyvinyltransferase n=1 Tax=Halomonas sp. Y3 TaxID=2956797 RepID=UPI0020A11C61|nr:UDP-N-acetylglucosamine 1-carboxyvinyltransferase [Halomonas sp. Y3]
MPQDMLVKGKQVPKGKVVVSGAKNSATPLLAAALLAEEPVRLRNFPTQLVDAKTKMNFIRELGAQIDINDVENTIEIVTTSLDHRAIRSYELGIRTTYLLAAGQLIRNGIAYVPYPGGCKIGSRGYDLHMMVWRQLGCEVKETQNYLLVKGKLAGGQIDFPISTVGGTENALICAAVAEGHTEIRNAYITPEVEDLIALLRQMGSQIESYGNSLIRVHGQGSLLRGASYQVMLDRIEALTWIIYGVMSGGEIMVEGLPFEHMDVPLLHLKEAGIDLYRNSNSVYVTPDCVQGQGIQPFELACGTHPGVISDMQSFYTLLGMEANGKSRIFDYRYPERIAYAEQLNRFSPGVIEVEHGRITTQGVAHLQGCEVQSTDLRGSMALVMAALCAEGESVVRDVHMALRGYNDLVGKLKHLGVEVKVIDRAV